MTNQLEIKFGKQLVSYTVNTITINDKQYTLLEVYAILSEAKIRDIAAPTEAIWQICEYLKSLEVLAPSPKQGWITMGPKFSTLFEPTKKAFYERIVLAQKGENK